MSPVWGATARADWAVPGYESTAQEPIWEQGAVGPDPPVTCPQAWPPGRAAPTGRRTLHPGQGRGVPGRTGHSSESLNCCLSCLPRSPASVSSPQSDPYRGNEPFISAPICHLHSAQASEKEEQEGSSQVCLRTMWLPRARLGPAGSWGSRGGSEDELACGLSSFPAAPSPHTHTVQESPQHCNKTPGPRGEPCEESCSLGSVAQPCLPAPGTPPPPGLSPSAHPGPRFQGSAQPKQSLQGRATEREPSNPVSQPPGPSPFSASPAENPYP